LRSIYSKAKQIIKLGDLRETLKEYPSFFKLIIADPPFGINLDKRLDTRGVDYEYVTYDDDYSDDEYYQFSYEWIKACYDSLTDDGTLIIISGYNQLFQIMRAYRKVGFKLINHPIWTFKQGMNCTKKYVTSHYHILFLVKGNKWTFNHKKSSQYKTDVLNYPDYARAVGDKYRIKGEKGHLCQLPIKLLKDLVYTHSNFEDWVGDVFSGSGGTALACRMLGRNVVSFEREEKFIPTIKEKSRYGKKVMLDGITLEMLK
jgi:site-specific DNA-methyltransferase (adenine-specific)